MKISEIFNLRKSQHELDFVDVDVDKDMSLFLDPFFISTRKDPLSTEADRTIKSFFQQIIDLIKTGKGTEARLLLSNMNEPNETCLGLSTGAPNGRGVASENADWIYESLLKSNAVRTGLVENLEDSALFIDGIGRDKISDATTNIIRKILLKYTIDQCELHNIDITENVPSGFYWDPNSKRWIQEFTRRLIINNKRILLVPKILVSFYKDYVASNYYQHFVLNFLQGEHIKNQSALVKLRKDDTPYVTKRDISENDSPYSKEFLREFTQKHPEIFSNFRDNLGSSIQPVTNEKISQDNLTEIINRLITRLISIPAGSKNASNYHNLIIGILELIFYPNLTNPRKEKPINSGRKRIDITFDNSASNGYFYRLHNVHKIISRYIFAECKNYSCDPTNPELDQLSGRLSTHSSNFGILTCRRVEDKDLLIKRCTDLWKQKEELIIILSDQDIISILNQIDSKQYNESFFDDRQRETMLG